MRLQGGGIFGTEDDFGKVGYGGGSWWTLGVMDFSGEALGS